MHNAQKIKNNFLNNYFRNGNVRTKLYNRRLPLRLTPHSGSIPTYKTLGQWFPIGGPQIHRGPSVDVWGMYSTEVMFLFYFSGNKFVVVSNLKYFEVSLLKLDYTEKSRQLIIKGTYEKLHN